MEYFRDICRKLKVNFMSIRIFYKNLLHFSMMASSAIGFHNEIPSMIIVSSYRCVVPSPTPHLLQGDFQDCTFTCTPPAWSCSCTSTCTSSAWLRLFLPNSRPGQIKVAPAVLHLRSSSCQIENCVQLLPVAVKVVNYSLAESRYYNAVLNIIQCTQ